MNHTAFTAGAQLATAAGDHHVLASGFFSSGYNIGYTLIGAIALVSLVMGSAKTIGKQSKEGSGAGITHQIGTIVLSVIILLSCAIAAGIVYEMQRNGVRNSVPVTNPFGTSNGFGQ